MINYLKYIFIILFISNSSILEARKLNLKSSVSKENKSSTYGGLNFENELESFRNNYSINSDKNNKYYGWETNKDIVSSGDPKAIKGGTFTMLGGDEYPTTFRSTGKDTRHQINGLMDALQNEPLLGFNYEKLEWEPAIATHWKIGEDSLTYWFRIDPRARWADGKDIVADDIVAAYNLLVFLYKNDGLGINKEIKNIPSSSKCL